MEPIQVPAFVLEEKKLVENLKIIQKVQKEADVKIILALKGFALWNTFPLIKQYLDGAAASSLNEAYLSTQEMGCKPHTYCVAYVPQEFDTLCQLSSHIIFNSLNQYHHFIEKVPKHVKIGLRVNPLWSDVDMILYDPSSPTSRLGITSEKLQKIPERVTGLHFHTLCESDANATKKALQVFEEKFGHFLPQISWVNIGGGHLVTKKGYDIDQLVDSLKSFKAKYEVDIILEPGGAIVWQTGYLITTVLDIVNNGGTQTAILDISFACHAPDCLEIPYLPAISGAAKTKIAGGYAYQLGGLSCLAGDFLGLYWFEKPLEIGQHLKLEDMIHYTMVKTTFFNGIGHPTIVLQTQNGKNKIIRAFQYHDYKTKLS